MKELEKVNKIKKILLILIIIGLILVIFLISKRKGLLIPDYASGVVDTNAIKEDTTLKKNYSEGSGNVNLKFSDVIEIDKAKKSAKLFFKNPGTSSATIEVYLIIKQGKEDIVLGKSDMIPAGYAIYNMNLDNVDNLQVGGYNGILKTVYYNGASNAKEMIDSEINIKIEVK